MIKLTIIVLLLVGAAVGGFLFAKNNANKVKKIDNIVDEIKK